MLRRRLAAGAAAGALVAGVVLVELSRTPQTPSATGPASLTTPPTTADGPLTFGAPGGSPEPIDSIGPGAKVVRWSVSGSCSRSGRTFMCKVTVMASNHLRSGGFVYVFPSKGYGQSCESRGALVQRSLVISGACEEPFASNVLVLYSSTLNLDGRLLAEANLPWSGGTGNSFSGPQSATR